MTKYFRRSTQAGDTIVEVIIAVAVISSLLVGAYTVTERSARAVRDSEEHTQALQLLQGQVELLRSAASTGALRSLPNLTTPFCFRSDGTAAQPVTPTTYCSGTSASDPVHYTLQISCPSGGVCPKAVPDTTSFQLTTTWPAIDGNTASVGLFYKVAVQ